MTHVSFKEQKYKFLEGFLFTEDSLSLLSGRIFLTVTSGTSTTTTPVQRNENSLAFVPHAWPSELKELM